MQRIAFKMKLHEGCLDEYKRRHEAIWPELVNLLTESGVSDYSIFLDEETNTLFAVQRQSTATSSQDLSDHPIIQRWWAYMADLMDTRPDNSPVSTPLLEVFHMQ